MIALLFAPARRCLSMCRIIAPVIGLPVKQIRVIKPRIGGGFGNKQEVLIEDVAAHLTIATGKPVVI